CGGRHDLRVLANVWFTGMNANWGDAEVVQATIDEWRPVTVRLELPQLTTWFDFFAGIAAVTSGQLSRGMRGIDDAREQFAHGHRQDDARTHLGRSLELLSHEPDATYAREATALLESL